ncbi:hypothetical protein EBB07_07950 [Paenibacillaceae bacterium]|nr:hypothetical protein EBB07_07950 [Paenibacillaceae bacterium]
MMTLEKIMVCVNCESHAEQLIRRGVQLSQLLKSPLYVLSIDPELAKQPDDKQERCMAEWRKISQEAGAEFIMKNFQMRKPCDGIVESAKEKQITQLIIGQSAQTRWQEITRGSLINELLNKVGEIDLHVVAVGSE